MRALRFYWLVAASGGVLMALEILSIRLLSPHFGNSVYTWGSIIGTFLAALSLGYALGGRFADRYPTLPALGRLVVLTGLAQAVLLLAGEPLAAAFGRATGGAPWGTLATASVLFGPTSVLLGMVSPWAVRIAAHDLGHLGHTAGRLYALSTAGSLVGTLACTFLLIPFLDLGQILGLLLATTAATGGVALLASTRREAAGLALAAALLALGLVSLAPRERSEGALYRRITPYQTLQVVEVDGNRYLVSDGITQAGIRLADGGSAISYSRLMPGVLLFKREPATVLLLGLGGGNCAAVLREARLELAVDYVEIDPAVPEVARRFLRFAPPPSDRVHIDDARRFLAASDRRWDVIVADTYIGRSVPFHLATREFFALVHQRLAPGGVLAVNLAGGLESPFSRAIFRTLSESFQNLYAFRAPASGNVVVLATDGTARLLREEIVARAQAIDRDLALEVPLATIARDLAIDVDLEILEAPLLTDDLAPVERLVAMSPSEPLVFSNPQP